MDKGLLLGIDIGTSGCKLSVFDFQGQRIASTAQGYDTYYSLGGRVEQDVTMWWKALCHGLKVLKRRYGVGTEAIAAIGVAGQSWACIPVDRNGIPLRKAMIWLDRRSLRQTMWLKDRFGGERLARLSGNPVDPAYVVPKLLWLKDEEPEVFRNIFKCLQSNSYIVLKLTGEYSQDYSQGYGFHFFDISNGCFVGQVAEEMGIFLDLLPPLDHSHTVVGTVTGKAAGETGLCRGTPVVAGGLDAACCTLGAGVVIPGLTQEQGGQAGGMSILLDRPLVHEKLISGCHVIPGQWLLQGGTVGGGALRWFNGQFQVTGRGTGKDQDVDPYDRMSIEAGGIEPGSGGLIFLPFMAGERTPLWDNDARGVLFGLSYETTRAHVIRAVMEGVAYSLLHNLRTAGEVGARVDELVSVGGAANSRVWTQIKADVTGKRFLVPDAGHATTLGAAILGGLGVGVYRDAQEAVRATVQIKRVHEPNEENHRVYEELFQVYIGLYNKNKDSFRTLGAIRERMEAGGGRLRP